MILLDANFLLEMLIAGRSKSQKAFRFMAENQEEFCISMLSVHLVMHFGLKDGLTISHVKGFLEDYPKVALLPEDYSNAMRFLKDADHEDALQLAVAERTGCSAIVTLDHKFADTYKDRMHFITI